MAVVYENLQGNLVRAYSDKGFYIRGGFPEGDYEEAIDPKSANRKYTETSEKIPQPEATIEDYQKALKELGVEL